MILVVSVLALTAFLSFQLALYVGLRSHGSRTAVLMASTMAATAWWAGGNAVEDLVDGLAAKLVFANLEYLAIASLPVLWFALGWSLYREERTGKPGRLSPVFWIVPAITGFLVWTDPVLGLVRRGFRLEEAYGFTSIVKVFGPWFWVHSAYSYLLVAAGTVLLILAQAVGWGIRRAQHVILIVGSVLPALVNVLYLSRIIPSGSVDPTPLAFSITGVMLVFNLTRLRFLSLVTAARSTAIEQLRDPVLVLDRNGRLAYANYAATSAFSLGVTDIGRLLSEIETRCAGLAEACSSPRDPSRREPLLSHGEHRYEVRTGTILRGERLIGSVVTLFDVTGRISAEEELRQVNLLLEQRIALRTRALQQSNAKLTEELEQRRRAERQLAHDVLHDPLTGLPNRSMASSRIEQLLQRMRRDRTQSCGVLFMGFDGFKAINDTWGHAAGDSFLTQMAGRLTSSVRSVDLCARVGGDEFMVVLDGSEGSSSFDQVAERIADRLCIPLPLGGGTVVPSVSTGIAVATQSYKDPESLIHDAEIAMERAKARGRSQRVTFTEEMRQQADEHNLLTAALRTAIAAGGITLAYQPIVGLEEHAPGSDSADDPNLPGPVIPSAVGPSAPVLGWEVLARWRHEQLGPVRPDKFIAIAEESGLIVPLGAYILIEALKTASELHSMGLLGNARPASRYFSVNVSPIQLGQPDFPEFVLAAVDRAGLPRSVLHLELTESAIMQNREMATRVIQRLSAEGISFMLDDFGTGYSSLGYLHTIPIDTVKVDRSFVSRLVGDGATEGSLGADGSAGVVRGIISLSHELGKSVVAEGIETSDQARMLREHGCNYGQGYFFGKPADKASLFASLGPVAAAPVPPAAAESKV